MLRAVLHCHGGHRYVWTSQPIIDKMAAGNLLIPAAVIVSGTTFTVYNHMAEILNLASFNEREHYYVQHPSGI